jgi:hypothetical protein
MVGDPTTRTHRRAAVWFLIAICLRAVGSMSEPVEAAAAVEGTYIGSQSCSECHAEAYASYQQNSQKSHSFGSVKIMMPKLTAEEIRECYACHTTGYGRPGGFVSEEKTPNLANAGCEVCHGPGARHAETQSAEDIKGKLTVKDCVVCHKEERVGTFRYKPMLFGGGH